MQRSPFLGCKKTKNILCVGYFLPYIFKDCIQDINKFHPCHAYTKKLCSPPLPLCLVVSIGPFAKWGVDFMTCNPPSAIVHHYILVVVDYFRKWEKSITIMSNDGIMEDFFIFNHIIARFFIPKEIVIDHGSHFQNHMMEELASQFSFHHEY